MEITPISAVEGRGVRWPAPVAAVEPARPLDRRDGATDERAQGEPGLRPALVPGLASEIATERRRGELQPWQELSGQYLLVLASRFTAGAPTPLPDRLLEAGLRYVADGGSAAAP